MWVLPVIPKGKYIKKCTLVECKTNWQTSKPGGGSFLLSEVHGPLEGVREGVKGVNGIVGIN